MRSTGQPREVITNCSKTAQRIKKPRRPRRPRHKVRTDTETTELEIGEADGRRAEIGRFMKQEHVGLGSLKIKDESSLPGVDIF